MINNFKDKIKNIFREGVNEDRAKHKLNKVDLLQDFPKILAIVEPYKTTKAGKNNKHINKLVDFFISGTPIHILKTYYDRFIVNNKINEINIDNYNWIDFERLIDDGDIKNIKNINKINIDKTTDTPLFQNDKITIYLGDTVEKCIKYGQGEKYNICISRNDTLNQFWRYRFDGNSFYFVYFNKEKYNEKIKREFIVLIINEDDSIKVNYIYPNKDIDTTKEKLIKEIPELNEFIDKLKFIPLSDYENNVVQKCKNTRFIIELEDIKSQILFLQFGGKVHEKHWDVLPKENVKILLPLYIELRIGDVSEKILDEYPNLKKRYFEQLLRRIKTVIEVEGSCMISSHVSKYMYLIDDDVNFNHYFNIIMNTEKLLIIYAASKKDNLPDNIKLKILASPSLSYDYSSRLNFNVSDEFKNAFMKDEDLKKKYEEIINTSDDEPAPAFIRFDNPINEHFINRIKKIFKES